MCVCLRVCGVVCAIMGILVVLWNLFCVAGIRVGIEVVGTEQMFETEAQGIAAFVLHCSLILFELSFARLSV